MKLLVANGYVIDPSQGLNAGRNLLIEDGRVAGVLWIAANPRQKMLKYLTRLD